MHQSDLTAQPAQRGDTRSRSVATVAAQQMQEQCFLRVSLMMGCQDDVDSTALGLVRQGIHAALPSRRFTAGP